MKFLSVFIILLSVSVAAKGQEMFDVLLNSTMRKVLVNLDFYMQDGDYSVIKKSDDKFFYRIDSLGEESAFARQIDIPAMIVTDGAQILEVHFDSITDVILIRGKQYAYVTQTVSPPFPFKGVKMYLEINDWLFFQNEIDVYKDYKNTWLSYMADQEYQNSLKDKHDSAEAIFTSTEKDLMYLLGDKYGREYEKLTFFEFNNLPRFSETEEVCSHIISFIIDKNGKTDNLKAWYIAPHFTDEYLNSYMGYLEELLAKFNYSEDKEFLVFFRITGTLVTRLPYISKNKQ